MIKPAQVAWLAIALILGSNVTQASEPVCQTLSARMLDHLDKADFSGATQDFDDRMKTALSADKLAQVWQSLPTHFGVKGARDAATVKDSEGYEVVITPLHYGSGLIDAQVACSVDGRIAGFYIKPHH